MACVLHCDVAIFLGYIMSACRSTQLLVKLALVLALASSAAQATMIGQWTFEGANPLQDATGHFSGLQLYGNASVSNGALNLNGSGTTPTGWGRAYGYTGSALSDKTMVAWITMENLASTAFAGAPMA